MTEVALNTPHNGVIEIAGPERFRLAELVQKFLNLKGDTRSVVTDSQARYYGALLSDVVLLPAGDARVGSVKFADWFEAVNV